MESSCCTADIATAPGAVSVFLVEDSAIIRDRLLSMLVDTPGVTVVGHADNAKDAIERILAAPPHAVVLDIKLRDSSGMDVLRALKPRLPAMVVIVLSNYATPAYRRPCLELGAKYCLDKTNEFHHIPRILSELKTHCC